MVNMHCKISKKYIQDHFHTHSGYLNSFLKKLGLAKLINNIKVDQNYFKYFESKTVNFFSSNIDLFNFEI